MVEDSREFLIPVQRRWTLWILPILALAYFAFVIALAVTNRRVTGIPMEALAMAGLALFLLVILIELPFFLRRPAPRDEEAAPPSFDDPEWQDETPEPMSRAAVDDEKLVTSETQHDLRVLEYSSPAKSRRRGSVYAKTYVPVSKEHVLRVETLTAEPHEL